MYHPNLLTIIANTFSEHVKDIIEMGFKPSEKRFVHALKSVSTMSKKTWETKMEVYGRWGWSENEIKLAFRKFPICMSLSEKNIMSTVDFLVNKMGWKPSAVVQVPTVLGYSLEKRIIPRCSIIRVLVLKGLINKETPLSTILVISDQRFLDTFVTKYQDEASQLSDIFQGKMGLLELGFAFEQKSDTKNK
ncbi:hypothetical protein LWI29_003694 [Acer saccharum]|uniref:Uncharacterized protein n=1 Tax=Acer saccharum TaxID=4024 RepID=A0AA39S0A1_ACESA|nr:hypothetical protein LWI29_003694 [Acer saccharum]